MATQPKSMSPAEWEKHVAAAKTETARRAAVEANPTDTILALMVRIEALEGGKKPAVEKPAEKPEKPSK